MLTVEIDAEMLRGMLGDGSFKRAVDTASEMTLDAVKGWYIALPEDYFDNPEPFPDGTPRHGGARTFQRQLGISWFVEPEGDDSFNIYFSNNRDNGSPWGLRLQHYGGDIEPQNARALTIPVTAEARGRRADAFAAELQRDLFVVGRNGEENEGTLCWRDDQGQLHAAYLLRKRATIKPLEERLGRPALPPDEFLQGKFREYLNEAIDFELNWED